MRRVLSILFFTIMLFVLSSPAFAQLKSANKLYDKGDYEKAIPYYIEYLNTNTDLDASKKLADCYRLTSKYIEAEKLYSKIISQPKTEAITYFYYGTCLKNNNKLNEAKVQFQKYLELAPGEKPMIEVELKQISQIHELSKTLLSYEINNIKSLNTAGPEFGAIPYKNGIVFASSRDKDLVDFDYSDGIQIPYNDLYFSEVKKQKQINPTNISANQNSVIVSTDYSDITIWSEPSGISNKINHKYHEGPATFSADGKTIYFTRIELKRTAKNVLQNKAGIYFSEASGDGWSNPHEFEYNNNDYSFGHPSLSFDGNKLYFVSDMPGGYGGKDIYVCIKENNKWSKPQNLGPAVNTSNNELFPYIRKDSVLFFASDAPDGLGGLDIYSAVQRNSSWEKPVNLGSIINSTKDDFAISFNTDGQTGYFTSNRDGGLGDDDLYYFKTINKLMNISGKILLSEKTKDPASGLRVLLLGEDGNIINVTSTDQSGYFIFHNIEPDQHYLVKIDEQDPDFIYSKKYFLTDEANRIIRVTVVNKKGGVFVFENLPADVNNLADLSSIQDADLTIAGNILYGESNKPLANYRISLYAENGSLIKSITTNELGGFVFTNLPPDQKYNIQPEESEKKLPKNTRIVITNKQGKEILSTYTTPEGFFRFNILASDKAALAMLSVEDTELKINMKGQLVNGDNNKPLADLKINLFNNKNELIKFMIADHEGKFAFFNLPADESYVFDMDDNDPALKGVNRIHILDSKGKLIREVKRDNKGKFRFRRLPIDKNEFAYVYVDDPWLEAINLQSPSKNNKNDSLTIIENIYYTYGDFKILPDAQKTLDKVIRVMNLNPDLYVEISSHTDSRSGDAFNMQLSQKRATEAVKYITEHGITSNRLTGKGYGETRLINRCKNGVDCSEDEHAANRRTEFKVYRKK